MTAGRVDTPGFVSGPQMREMVARGHVIGSHSYSHPKRMGGCPPETIAEEWRRSVDVLQDVLGAPVLTASVPGGFYTRPVGVAAAAAGIRVLFTSAPTTRAHATSTAAACSAATRCGAGRRRHTRPALAAGALAPAGRPVGALFDARPGCARSAGDHYTTTAADVLGATVSQVGRLRRRPMRVLYLYPSLIEGELEKVKAGEAPTDRLYGLVELRSLGHQVDIADSRFKGRFGRLVKRLRHYSFNICDLTTVRQIRGYDVVVVKDEFSPMVTAACHMSGAKIVYLDALMQVPRHPVKRALYRAHIRRADGVAAFSQTQIDLWSRLFDLPSGALTFLPYTIDMSFYTPAPAPPPRPRP